MPHAGRNPACYRSGGTDQPAGRPGGNGGGESRCRVGRRGPATVAGRGAARGGAPGPPGRCPAPGTPTAAARARSGSSPGPSTGTCSSPRITSCPAEPSCWCGTTAACTCTLDGVHAGEPSAETGDHGIAAVFFDRAAGQQRPQWDSVGDRRGSWTLSRRATAEATAVARGCSFMTPSVRGGRPVSRDGRRGARSTRRCGLAAPSIRLDLRLSRRRCPGQSRIRRHQSSCPRAA